MECPWRDIVLRLARIPFNHKPGLIHIHRLIRPNHCQHLVHPMVWTRKEEHLPSHTSTSPLLPTPPFPHPSSLHHPSLTPPPVTDNILPLALVTPPAACNCVPPAGDAEPATLKGVKPGNKWVLLPLLSWHPSPPTERPSPIPCHTSDGGGDTVPGYLSLTLSRTTTRPTSHATSPAYSLTHILSLTLPYPTPARPQHPILLLQKPEYHQGKRTYA
ncbi:hypothetical protein Pmani_016371 [Petrolisthes manimaculis]|uniref:Uncharacterized protein n=1 Tax=Petrolisthes manimaculis TaxID=1843537 RepID=A0AAE1PSD1_9EUCA|nr:hypothetical protein Pmani_016371 [Petrolisthes manimaculis]